MENGKQPKKETPGNSKKKINSRIAMVVTQITRQSLDVLSCGGKLAKAAPSLLDFVDRLLISILSPFKQPRGNFCTLLRAEYIHGWLST